jgi:hypothetical protein
MNEDVVSGILAFVNGTMPWHELNRLGIGIEIGADQAKVESDYSRSGVHVGAREVARGLLARSQRGDVREYSLILLAATFIDVGELDAHPLGDRLRSAVWDAAAGRAFSRRTLQMIEKIAADVSARLELGSATEATRDRVRTDRSVTSERLTATATAC